MSWVKHRQISDLIMTTIVNMQMICALLFSAVSALPTPAQSTNCQRVVELSASEGVPRVLAVSLAWHESKFTDVTNPISGARGVLQVLPKWHCPTAGPCDYTLAGVRALWRYLRIARGEWITAICGYNQGRHCRVTMWVRSVVYLARRLEVQIVPS